MTQCGHVVPFPVAVSALAADLTDYSESPGMRMQGNLSREVDTTEIII
jgi:hypothetical protein